MDKFYRLTFFLLERTYVIVVRNTKIIVRSLIMKLWRIIFLLLLTVVLVACSNDRENNEATNTDETNENKAEEESGIEVDKGIFDVEITLPASLFGEEELEDIENEIQESTDADITLNDDGSITVNMSKS